MLDRFGLSSANIIVLLDSDVMATRINIDMMLKISKISVVFRRPLGTSF